MPVWKASTARKMKRLVAIIAGLAPFKPNADSLASERVWAKWRRFMWTILP